MWEEGAGNMEKKPTNRTSSVPPKGSGNDNKRNDNGTPNKSQKHGRRRDSGGNRSSIPEMVNRRPVPQKSRATEDKRPRSRGGPSIKQRDDVAEEIRAEFGSAIKPGSKKANLNHLLNFSLAPRDHYGRGGGPRFGRKQGRYTRCKTIYNKEQFLQANCQFVVKDDGDYAVHHIDPDVLVHWDAVQQVRVNSRELPSCPICLQPPTAAKITRCGHIYCWPCILHYLTLGEKSWRKCPICYEAIHTTHLKSVATQEVHQYRIGESITMTLMKKAKGCTYAVPMSAWEQRDGRIHRIDDPASITQFMKLLLASPEQVQKLVIDPERMALQQQLTEAEPSEVAFIDSALALLKEHEAIVTGQAEVTEAVSKILAKPSDQVHSPRDTAQKVIFGKSFGGSRVVRQYASAFSDDDEEEEEEDTTARSFSFSEESDNIESPPLSPDLCELSVDDSNASGSSSDGRQSPHLPRIESAPAELAGATATGDMTGDTMLLEEATENLELPSACEDGVKKRNPSGDNAFYFYQDKDGQHIYLNALNARCLAKEYGGLEYSPNTITANIVEMESVTMSEELRKRLRYLGHLPLTCQFEVVEMALKPPVLSKETLASFSDDIDRRRRLRQKRNRDDNRWTKKVEAEESRQLGIAADITIQKSEFKPHVAAGSGSHTADNPGTVNGPPGNLPSPYGSPSELNVNALEFVPGTSPASSVLRDDGQQSTTLSFAQMLRAGKVKTPVWPKPVVQTPEVSRKVGSPDSDASDSEDRVPVPIFQRTFGEAIEAAFENIPKSKGEDEDNTVKPEPSSGKKKKKQKQLLLFSTSMARNGK